MRWWMAILAPNQGWKAIVFEDGQNQSISPWSVAVDSGHPLKVRSRRSSISQPLSPYTPPSSREALNFLTEFCMLHGIHSQIYAALTAAIVLPIHNFYRMSAMLPFPRGSDRTGRVSSKANME